MYLWVYVDGFPVLSDTDAGSFSRQEKIEMVAEAMRIAEIEARDSTVTGKADSPANR